MMNKIGNHLNRRYDYLEDLFSEFSEFLADAFISSPVGEMEDRAGGALHWRRCLLRGELPRREDLPWPPSPFCENLLADLDALDIARFCKGQEELTDSLLADILESIETFAARRSSQYAHIFKELEGKTLAMKRAEAEEKERAIQEAKKRERLRLIKTGAATTGDSGEGAAASDAAGDSPLPSVALSEDEKREIQKQAQKQADEIAGQTISAAVLRDFLQEWKERVDVWKQIAEVFGDLGDLLRVNGRDLSRGILQSQGWLEIANLRRLVEQIPQFKEIIQSLGRMQMSQDESGEFATKQIFELARRTTEEIVQKPAPVPHEMRGIRRSDDIHRMLPQEAAFLGHPKLKMLWHARRAEQALLTYQMEGVMPQKIVEERDMETEKDAPGERQKLERGPIICCLDTSSSMQGTPELVAKALTLEAVRLANAENRRCYLFSFSGTGNLVEHELKISEDGLADFLKFLTLSFHGGTDINEPLNRATAKLDGEQWTRADILLVTDGAIDYPREEIMQSVRRHKEEKQLKIHGVLVGSPSNSAMDEICTHLHQFSEWMHIMGDR